MKNILILGFLIFLSLNVYSQWQWSQHIYSILEDQAGPICKDNLDNIYVAGTFEGIFCYFQTDTLLRKGSSDFFIIKYDNEGNEIWVKQFGGFNTTSCDERVTALSFDSNSNYIYAYSHFCSTSIFGNDTLTALGEYDIALFKIDTSGNITWTAQVQGSAGESGLSCTVDDSGNVYICGGNTANSTFDTIILSPGGFLAKYNSAGSCLWAKHICDLDDGGNANQFAMWSIIFNDNSLYIGGATTDDTLTIDTINIASPNEVGGILSKFDLNGNIYWARVFGYPNAGCYSMGMDDNKNIFLAGNFGADSAFFDTTLLTNTQSDTYFAKCDSNGIFLWIKQLHITGSSPFILPSLTVAENGSFYLTGTFSGSATFGNDTITATNDNMFIAHYNSNGECIGVDHFGMAYGSSVITDNNDRPIITGYFLGTVQIGSNVHVGSGTYDIFVAKHDDISNIEDMERKSNELVIYANPNKGTCSVLIPDDFLRERNLILNIYDNSGKVIQQGTISINEEKVLVNLEAEATGIYNILLSNGKKNYSGKIIFE